MKTLNPMERNPWLNHLWYENPQRHQQQPEGHSQNMLAGLMILPWKSLDRNAREFDISLASMQGKQRKR